MVESSKISSDDVVGPFDDGQPDSTAFRPWFQRGKNSNAVECCEISDLKKVGFL